MSKIELRGDRHDVFVIVDGVAIARLGRPNTPEAGTWVSLKTGWIVTSNEDHSEIEVMHDGTWLH
jgi:hypothetical protein